ncbi:MAG: hypothetical protein LBT80_04365 [Lactobacillaceae bacterium]|jgi:hypothetical protein|nr:hypothetical protein [Lactobacillaceae bacterium]
MKNRIDYNEYDFIHNDPSISAQGLPFSLNLLSFAFSMVMVPMLIFMLSNFFADKFQDKKNMDILFPQQTKICERNRFLAATLLFLAVYLIIVVFSLVIGTLVNGLGDVHFPLYYILENKVGQLTVGGALLQTVILQFLSCTAVIALLQLMNNVTKNHILSILLTMLITVPQIVAPIVLPVFNKVMHLIPGAYIATPNIIDTAWANQTHNYQLTFVNGILVSSVYLFALLLVNYGYTQNAGRGLFIKASRTLSMR